MSLLETPADDDDVEDAESKDIFSEKEEDEEGDSDKAENSVEEVDISGQERKTEGAADIGRQGEN